MSDNMKTIIWATLAVALLGIAPARAQNSSTNCYRFGNGTMCETRDYYGRTVQRTQCWPAGRGNITCQTRDNPNGYNLSPMPGGSSSMTAPSRRNFLNRLKECTNDHEALR